ncbi:NB-ARC domain-containing protein [Microcoleus sp. PH2017_05_CCC_O_A]|uniref:NB-ARC domain-containing protein n=1 Tax=Microcoleus sp. PH2017_05_CCC_O_A TaxID=2798816 RepID=UPI0025FCF694|nr:NB-ARC domain-containing protein [Microcoleus sp. PH2017_05_CCC_O_A]
MDIQEVLKIADQILFTNTGKHLNHLQEGILRGTWQRQKYPEIATNCHRSEAHVKKVAAQLWKLLSEILGEDINQSNFGYTVERLQLSIVESKIGKYSAQNDNSSVLGIGLFHSQENDNFVGVVSLRRPYLSTFCMCLRARAGTGTPPLQENEIALVCGNYLQSLETAKLEKQNQVTCSNTQPKKRLDLSDAPEPNLFYNPTSELTTLKQWIWENRTRLITIYGLSGIGKTSLTLQLIPEVQHEFDYIIYRSLRNSPPLQTLQTNLIQFVSQQQEIKLPSLIEHLRSSRCLIIIDDIQTIFSSGQLAGNYQPGYENYGTFFKELAASSHNSCLILLSWEKPREIAALEGENRPCKSLQLNGLGAEAREIFREKRLAEEEKWSQLIDLYRGNPLWLNIVATMIQDLFGGSVSEFLSYDTLFLGDLESLLHQQCDRLFDSEKQVISWLAREATPVEISKFSANLELSPSALLQAVQSLGRRLLIEKVKQGEKTLFTLQPVLMEYVKNQFLKVG